MKFVLCDGVDAYVGGSIQIRLEPDDDIVAEHGAREICLCVCSVVEAVQHLNVSSAESGSRA